jgi:ketosteroid isomerase-like protein
MNEAFFRAYYEAYNSGQEARLAEFLTDDIVLTSAQGEQRGREAYLATYRQIIAVFSDRMTPEDIAVSGQSATIRIIDRFVAKQDVADFLGRAFAQGEGFTLHLLGRYEVRDGKIASIDIQIAGAE